MKTDNELIAEFMGMIQNPHRPTQFTEEQFYVVEDGVHYGLWKESSFSTSWDWLMPVVEKIDSLGYHVTIMKTRTIISITNNVQNHIQSIHPGYSMIEVVYSAVVEFIKWYNQQKSV